MRASREALKQLAEDDAAASHRASGAVRQVQGPHLPAALATTLACFVILLALLMPNDLGRLTPSTFVSFPLEAVLGVALLLLLSERARWAGALLLGLALGLLTIMKLLDIGFMAVLARPFHPAADWSLLENAMRFLAGAIGPLPAIGCLAAAVIFCTALLIIMVKSVQRVAGLAARQNVTASRAIVVLAALWLSCAVFGAQIAPGVPVAVVSSADYLQHRHPQAGTGLEDERKFNPSADVDSFANTADDQLLTALRGKDVVLAFVESYGRSAIEDPEFAPEVGAILDAGNHRLSAAGFDSRSAFLTSPTAGGGSWLAHGTLLSGLWTDKQERYDALASSQRLTLTRAFRRAGWRTVGVMPGNDAGWPESASLGYDQVYDAKDLGYKGPRFSWASMPDQYTLLKFQSSERAMRGRQPVMAEVTLVSSHAPWEPIPRLVNWKDIGDGSVFNGMARAEDPPQAILTRKYGRVRADYRAAIEYSLSSLISYVQTYGDDKLVLIFLGDHQPSPIVTGYGVSRDVPITIVTRDHSVLNRISDWGWQQGLKPNSQAPVWRMDAFRDRFLTAFGPQSEPPQPAISHH